MKKTYWVIWTYVADYGGPIRIAAHSAREAVEILRAGFGDDIRKKVKIYVWDTFPVRICVPEGSD